MNIIKSKVKYIILIFAIALCVYGIYSGEMQVVLKKAVVICLECCGKG